MIRKPLIGALGMALVLVCLVVSASMAQDPTMKWQQLPDTSNTGFDVSCFNHPSYPPILLADDFECTQTGPITEIVIYSSWYHDVLPYDDPRNVVFTLSIHADIPDPDGPGPEYSMPGELLWLGSPPFDVEPYAVGLEEGWFEPPDYYTPYPDGDTICWKYTFHLDSTFIQMGTPDVPVVYWVDLQANTEDLTAFFGWKTSLDHWNDDAVWANAIDDQGVLITWHEMRYVAPHPFAGESVDLAFEIWGIEEEEPLWDCEQNPPPSKTGGGYETEPNNTCADVDAAQCEYSYCGVIDPSGGDNADWWQVVIPQDTCYCVDVRVFADYTPGTIATGGGLDPELTVYAADCVSQLFYNNDKNGTLPQCEGTDAQYDCNDAGNCHMPGSILNLKISPASAASVGPYLLVVNCYECTCPDEPIEDTCEYYKAPWEDYAPNGMPDVDQKQYNWIYPASGAWSHCGPVALADCLWWFDSKFEPVPIDPRPFWPGPGSPGLNDNYPLLPSFDPTGAWDDHDTNNVHPFVDSLALYCNTNTANSGTNVYDMYNGALNWLTKTGLSANYTVRLLEVNGADIDFEGIREEILISQDVILLLGFYHDFGGNCERVGGHYVTCAGVCTDPVTQALCISDPYFDNNESSSHGAGLHNDTWYVSGPHGTIHHDRYDVVPIVCPLFAPPFFQYELSGYPVNGTNVAAFHGQNLFDPSIDPVPPNPALAVHTVVEYALIICPVEEEIIDSVICEPQGSSGPTHPPTYWYDVFPNGIVGLHDFHVVTQDSIAGNYSNWVDPAGWTHLVHKVGSEWWVSWYDASTTNPVIAAFRFSFDNPNTNTWGHWTTTSSGATSPFTGVVDSSGRHSASSDGYGYRVHAPVLPTAVYDSVVCEPQGVVGPLHPPDYWYDVIPNTVGGLCDFHVVTQDSLYGNYYSWLEPPGWTHTLHKVGLEWWISWYNPGCTNPITTPFRFGFRNPFASTWGHWTTTVSGSTNPFSAVADSSGNHTASTPGNGYMVHVPHWEDPFVLDTCEYYKEPFEDYAPSGVPDFDMKQIPGVWMEMRGLWSHCGPVALADCLWWFDSKFEPFPVDPRPFYPSPTSPGMNDGYDLVQSYDPGGIWDDHDTNNVVPFIDSLAAYCLTNSSPWGGTFYPDLLAGANAWLTAQGFGADYTVSSYSSPDFALIRDEVTASHNVILLLGFWQVLDPPAICCRFGGHYVTTAGVCDVDAICISDPYFDMHEGEPPVGAAHSAGNHNDAFYVSGPHGTIHHDKYMVGPPTYVCGPAQLELYNYPDIVPDILNFDSLNWENSTTPYCGYAGVEFITVIEQALVIGPASTTCCIPPTVGDCDQSGGVDITDISVLVDNQFLTLTPLVCEDEGNLNYPGTSYPTTDTVVDITDLTILIDNQFLTLTPLWPCP